MTSKPQEFASSLGVAFAELGQKVDVAWLPSTSALSLTFSDQGKMIVSTSGALGGGDPPSFSIACFPKGDITRGNLREEELAQLFKGTDLEGKVTAL